MTYAVTLSGSTFTVDLTASTFAVTLSQVGQQGGIGPVGITWEGDWATDTDYVLNSVVSNGGSSHICILAHTSAAADEPGVGVNTATYWELLAEKGTDGAGTGTVTSIGITGGTGIDSSGGPVTSSGSITVALDSATQTSLGLADSAQQPPTEGAFVDGDKTKLDGIEALADVTDAANVAAAGALMDSEVTNLADVKAFDPADYATAAQGSTADSALQSTDIGVSVQGYSVVLAGTTASYTTAEETKLSGIEASADVTDTANVTAAGALMDSEVTNLADVKAFDPSDYATAAQGSTADTAVQPGDDADTLGSGAATDGHVLTADGAGGAAWEAVSGGDVSISGTPVDNDYAKFTDASTVEGRSTSEVRTDLGLSTSDSPAFAGLAIDTDVLYVDSVNNRVGINTDSPANALQVFGNVGITGTLNSQNISLIGTAVQPSDISDMVESDTTGITGADQITNIVSLTQAEYDAITPNASTLYVITT